MPIDCVQIPPGTVLAGYRIESELGRGNNAVVYLAEQQSLGRQVALKILLPELAAEPGYVESFLREARLAARLDHPYIVQAYEAGATPEAYYFFAMELVIGPSLNKAADLLKKRTGVPDCRFAGLMGQDDCDAFTQALAEISMAT